MFDAFAVTAQPSTARASAAIRTVSLPIGTITWVGVQFPTGCAGLAHARIHRSLHQLWPTDPDEDIASDGHIIAWRDSYPLLEPPYELRLEVWNDDDTYPHTVTFFFETTQSPPPPPGQGAPNLLDRLRQLVGATPSVPSPPVGEG